MQIDSPRSLNVKGKLDKYIFIKNYYLIVKYLLPFIVVCLLLLITSLSSDDLLLKLVNSLKDSFYIQLIAGSFTVLLIIIYFSIISREVNKAYLLNEGNTKRIIITSFACISICAITAFIILRTVSLNMDTKNEVWASFLIALLSLTGIGWNIPTSWVESFGIKSPDYTEAHSEIEYLADKLNKVRKNDDVKEEDIIVFFDSAQKLLKCINNYINLEPKWERNTIEKIVNELKILVKQRENFECYTSNIMTFSDACKYEKRNSYSDFTVSLTILSCYWKEWRYSELE